MSYQKYLRSEHWKKLRKRFLDSKRFKNKCFVCGEQSGSYHVHHKTYKRLGAEKLTNLVALCPSCHKEVHFVDGIKLDNVPEILNGRIYLLLKQKNSVKP